MLRRCLPLFMLAPLTLAGCESTTAPFNPSNEPNSAAAPADAAPIIATSEYVEMLSTLRDLYDRALARGYSQGDIVRAASARDAELDARMLGLGSDSAERLTDRLGSLRADLEGKYPELAEAPGRAESGTLETIGGAEMNATAACRWFPAASYLFQCARNGGLTTYIACAMVSWANYCDDIDFTDFLEGVGEASGALGGGGGGAY